MIHIPKNTATVAELIEKLQTLPQDAPVIVRTKYTGNDEEYAVKTAGVAEMHPNGKAKHAYVALLV